MGVVVLVVFDSALLMRLAGNVVFTWGMYFTGLSFCKFILVMLAAYDAGFRRCVQVC